MADNKTPVDRRSVLKSVAAGSAAVAGVSASATAETVEPEPVDQSVFEDTYESASAVENVFELEAQDLLADLLDDGLLGEADLTGLEPTGHPNQARSNGIEGVRVEPYSVEDDVEPRISAVVQKDGHAVQLFAHPESDTESYAIVEDDAGPRMIKAGTTSTCVFTGYSCEELNCYKGYSGWEVYNCNSRCTGGAYVSCIKHWNCGHDCYG